MAPRLGKSPVGGVSVKTCDRPQQQAHGFVAIDAGVFFTRDDRFFGKQQVFQRLDISLIDRFVILQAADDDVVPVFTNIAHYPFAVVFEVRVGLDDVDFTDAVYIIQLILKIGVGLTVVDFPVDKFDPLAQPGAHALRYVIVQPPSKQQVADLLDDGG